MTEYFLFISRSFFTASAKPKADVSTDDASKKAEEK